MSIWVREPVLDRIIGRMSSTREISFSASSTLPRPLALNVEKWSFLPLLVEGFPSWVKTRKRSVDAMPCKNLVTFSVFISLYLHLHSPYLFLHSPGPFGQTAQSPKACLHSTLCQRWDWRISTSREPPTTPLPGTQTGKNVKWRRWSCMITYFTCRDTTT